jgi:TPP-dependent pyruvate/acetoin dehydrogenase alpha subunit
VNDPGLYLDADELARWKARDPLILLRERMLAAGVDEGSIAAMDERVEQLLEVAVTFATESPTPSVDEFLAEVGGPVTAALAS